MRWFALRRRPKPLQVMAGAVSSALACASPAVAASSIPRLDYTQTCAQTPAVGMDRKDTVAACMKDEAAARAALPAVWNKSGKGSRGMCLAGTMQGGLPSYVELLTCLQGELLQPSPR